MREVCDRIASGELVLTVAKDLNIAPETLYRWGALPEYDQAYARARVSQAHALAEQLIAIGDTAGPEDAQAKRLMCDNRKWLASKLAPRLYGEKLEVESSGTVEHTVKFVLEPRKVTAG
jgi:hypothetical protein